MNRAPTKRCPTSLVRLRKRGKLRRQRQWQSGVDHPTANTWKIGEEIAQRVSRRRAALYEQSGPPMRTAKTITPSGSPAARTMAASTATAASPTWRFIFCRRAAAIRGQNHDGGHGHRHRKAAKIFYQANTSILTSSANFQRPATPPRKRRRPCTVRARRNGQTPTRHAGRGRRHGTWTPCGTGDTTPPTATLTAPSAGSTLTGTVTVSASATDNIGVASVDFTPAPP